MIIEYDEKLMRECYQKEMERRAKLAEEVVHLIFEIKEVLE